MTDQNQISCFFWADDFVYLHNYGLNKVSLFLSLSLFLSKDDDNLLHSLPWLVVLFWYRINFFDTETVYCLCKDFVITNQAFAGANQKPINNSIISCKKQERCGIINLGDNNYISHSSGQSSPATYHHLLGLTSLGW